MLESPNDWPRSTKPFRDYIIMKNGRRALSDRPKDGSVGIVIPVRDGLKFFKLCMYSVLSFTDVPYLLNIVDNMSSLESKKNFFSFQLNHDAYYTRYDEDFNFAAEVNLGLKEMFSYPEVKYGLILNAEAVVTPFWLSNMMTTMLSHPKIAVVGPLSNKAIPEQEDKERQGQVTTVQRVSGFCMLIRRSAYEEVGGFDENFKGGGFEDWDFCERVRRNGWHVLVDGTAYVHHFYKQFRKIDFDDQLRENEKYFFEKHPLVADLVKRGDLVKAAP